MIRLVLKILLACSHDKQCRNLGLSVPLPVDTCICIFHKNNQPVTWSRTSWLPVPVTWVTCIFYCGEIGRLDQKKTRQLLSGAVLPISVRVIRIRVLVYASNKNNLFVLITTRQTFKHIFVNSDATSFQRWYYRSFQQEKKIIAFQFVTRKIALENCSTRNDVISVWDKASRLLKPSVSVVIHFKWTMHYRAAFRNYSLTILYVLLTEGCSICKPSYVFSKICSKIFRVLSCILEVADSPWTVNNGRLFQFQNYSKSRTPYGFCLKRLFSDR